MHRNAATIESFYGALHEGVGENMASAYHVNAVFRDPVFNLRGPDIGDMWRMFCSAGTDLRVEFSSVTADDRAGSAHWEAYYTYRPTGRAVHNVVAANFEFDDDGLIRRHRDEFNLTTWARQALGLPGALLGWTPLVKNRIRKQAAGQLRKFQARRPGSEPSHE